MNYTKYKMRVKGIADSELFFSAICAFVDDWFVGLLSLEDGQSLHSIRHPWPDREITFTVSDELTLPTMRWILVKLNGLQVAAETLQRFEDYTGDRVSDDDLGVQYPSPVVWHIVHHCLEHEREVLASSARGIEMAARNLAVPESLKTQKRLRSKDPHVDKYLKAIFEKMRDRSAPAKPAAKINK